MEDVFRDWDAKIAKTISGAGIPHYDVEDLRGDIYLSMVRRDICGKYDPSRAKSFSTYMYKVIHSMIGNYFRDRKCKKRVPQEFMISVSEVVEVSDYHTHTDQRLFSEEMLAYDAMSEIEQNNFVESVLIELSMPKYKKLIIGANGVSISLRDAASLLFKGHTVKEIADSIGAKVSAVSNSLHGLKSIRWVYKNLPIVEGAA
jgi:RNA polymerase sigma factor (sigma-70 family)